MPAPTNYESYIQLLDEQIRQAMGVPALASIRPVAGSYALGQSQIDLFLQNEEAWLEQVQNALNRDVVQRLVRYNFGARAPETRLELHINKAELERLMESLVQLLSTSQSVQTPEGTLVADWQKIAQDLGIPYRILPTQTQTPMQMPMQMPMPMPMPKFAGFQNEEEDTDADYNAFRNGLGRYRAGGNGNDDYRMAR